MSKKENNSFALDDLLIEMGQANGNRMPEYRDDRPAKARAKSERAKKLGVAVAACSDLVQELDEAVERVCSTLNSGVTTEDYEDRQFRTSAEEAIANIQKALKFKVMLPIMGLEKLAERRAVNVLAKDAERALRENASS